MAVVSNSSPLILYAKIGRLYLLRNLFTQVWAPLAVRQEVINAGPDLPGATALASAPWIEWIPVAEAAFVTALRVELGRGEAEAIALALQQPLALPVLLDDRAARRRARVAGLEVIGSAGVLVRAKERGLIPSVAPVLNELRTAGLYLSQRTYHQALHAAGEALDS